MNAVKAQFAVTAGIVTATDRPDLARVWTLTSRDLDCPDDEQAQKIAQARDAALEYARSLINPSFVNYVNFQFIWF